MIKPRIVRSTNHFDAPMSDISYVANCRTSVKRSVGVKSILPPASRREGRNPKSRRSIESAALSTESGGRRKIPRRAQPSAATVTSAASGAAAPVARLQAQQAPPLWGTVVERGRTHHGVAERRSLRSPTACAHSGGPPVLMAAHRRIPCRWLIIRRCISVPCLICG